MMEPVWSPIGTPSIWMENISLKQLVLTPVVPIEIKLICCEDNLKTSVQWNTIEATAAIDCHSKTVIENQTIYHVAHVSITSNKFQGFGVGVESVQAQAIFDASK